MEIISTNINDSSQLEVYWQDEVNLDIDVSITYIKTAEDDIKNYVENISKPEVFNYAKTCVNTNTTQIINNTIQPLVSATANYVSKAEDFSSKSSFSAELSKQYANDKINQTHISNCITAIPQDITLELSGGSLTLKSGSKLYASDENGKFNEFVITSDKSITNNNNGKWFVIYNIQDNAFGLGLYNGASSGTSEPTEKYVGSLWFNTSKSCVYRYSGSSWRKCCLPLGIITVADGAIRYIDQVFNGFGYIGSTLFALPNVSGLIPYYRNPDGTLKSREFILDKVITNTQVWGVEPYILNISSDESGNYLGFTRANHYFEQNTEPHDPLSIWDKWYDPNENIMRQDKDDKTWTFIPTVYVGNFDINSSRTIKSLVPKFPFKVVDYNDYRNIQDYIIERGQSGNQWYELYKSKRLRQGGYSQTGTITFIKPYANSNYTLINGSNKSTTGFTANNGTIDWIADGQGV